MILDFLRILPVYHGLMTGKDGCHTKNQNKFRLRNWKDCLYQKSSVLTYVPWYLGFTNSVKYYFTCFLDVKSKLIEPIRIIWNSSLAGKELKMGRTITQQSHNMVIFVILIYLSPPPYMDNIFGKQLAIVLVLILSRILIYLPLPFDRIIIKPLKNMLQMHP